MRLMGFKGPEKRMKDVEYVLRFAAFYHSSYLHYRPSMSRFLTEDMRQHQHIDAKQVHFRASGSGRRLRDDLAEAGLSAWADDLDREDRK
jgi:hypothetical protein